MRQKWLVNAISDEHPSYVFCGPTAALMYDLAVGYDTFGKVHAIVPQSSHGSNSRLIQRHTYCYRDLYMIEQILITSPLQTTFDCARMLPFAQALAIADSAARAGLVAPTDLSQFADGLGKVAGVKAARRVVAHMDARAENGGESIARAAMIDLGFAVPELQTEFVDPVSGTSYRVDFLWTRPDGKRVIGELDGRQKYEDPSFMGGRDLVGVLTDERRRESRLTASGASVCRFSFADVCNRPRFERLLSLYGVPRAA